MVVRPQVCVGHPVTPQGQHLSRPQAQVLALWVDTVWLHLDNPV